MEQSKVQDKEIYCVYHTKFNEEYYPDRSITFIKVSDDPFIFNCSKHIILKDQKWFKSIGKEYAEYEVMYSMYCGQLEGSFQIPEYIGFTQYDIDFRKYNADLPISRDELIALRPRDLNFLYTQNFKWHNKEIFHEIGKRLNIELNGKTIIPMNGSFICHRDVFLKGMEKLSKLIESGELDKEDKSKRMQGIICERYLACFLQSAVKKVIQHKLPHDFITTKAQPSITLTNPPKVSFCTVCKGHIKETLAGNLKLIKNEDMEIVLLDCNKDLEDWVVGNFKEELASDKLKYFKEVTGHFHINHAKNMVHRLSKGKYVINLDADHYLTPQYIKSVQEAISNGGTLISGGRLGTTRYGFFHVRGFDEQLQGGWGNDIDYERRLLYKKYKSISVPNKEENIAQSMDESLLSKRPYRKVNYSGFGCGNVTDYLGRSIILENVPVYRKARQLIPYEAYRSIFGSYTGKSALLYMSPGGTGSQMVHMATRQLFDYFKIKEVTDNPDVVFYSGNIGVYQSEEHQNRAISIANKFKVPLIILPQTYGKAVEFSADKVYVMENQSADIVPSAILMPDLALSLAIPLVWDVAPLYREGWFFRVDDEKTTIPKNNLCDPSIWAKDVRSYFALAGAHEVIHTNRVSFAIAGLILERDVILYNNSYHKNKAIFDTWLCDFGCQWGK